MGRSTNTAARRFRPAIDTRTYVTSGSSGLQGNFKASNIQRYVNSVASIPEIASVLNTSHRRFSLNLIVLSLIFTNLIKFRHWISAKLRATRNQFCLGHRSCDWGRT
jgi:hypothetical protein